MGVNLLRDREREALSLLVGTFVLLLIVQLFQDSLNRIYNPANTVTIHTVLEFFSVFVSFTISIYGWFTYRETKTALFIWVPMIFFAAGSFNLLHALSFPGMPFFLVEDSLHIAGWFWIAGRITEASALIVLLLAKDAKTNVDRHWWMVAVPMAYVAAVSYLILQYGSRMPVLIIDGVGTTPLKNAFEYAVSLLLLLGVAATARRYRSTKDFADLELSLAFFYLFVCGLLLTAYTSVNDLDVMAGHIFKVLGYIYFLKGFYFSRLQTTFDRTRKTEQHLKETQCLLESFFNHTPDSIVIYDKKGTILRVNRGFEQMYGWHEDEVTGKQLQDIMPGMKEDIDEVIRKTSQGEALIAYETTRIRKDGERIQVNMTISPIRNGEAERMTIAAITRDVTRQRLAEQRIREAEQELIETVRRQQGIIFKFIRVNGEMIHTLCDGELLYRLGGTPGHVLGRELGEILDEKDAMRVRPYYERAWAGEEVTFELLLVQRFSFVTLKPIIRAGRVTEVIGSCVDISELRKTEELLQKSEKLAVVGELAAGVAHEIRNPLTTIRGFTQLLAAKLDPKEKPFIDLMLSELDRIQAITSEFMEAAQPRTVLLEPTNIKLVMEQVFWLMEPQALLKNVRMDLLYKPERTFLIGDANQLKQVFINLVKNALDATEQGGRIAITAEAEGEEDFLTIQVKDTGCGIPKEVLPRLGEPFYTLKGTGTGLGLMVSFRIIEAHGGSVQFYSDVNKGTRVVLKFPFPA